jgi:hypothetical protein
MLVLEPVLMIRREHASGKAIKAIARDLHFCARLFTTSSPIVTRTPVALANGHPAKRLAELMPGIAVT